MSIVPLGMDMGHKPMWLTLPYNHSQARERQAWDSGRATGKGHELYVLCGPFPGHFCVLGANRTLGVMAVMDAICA